MYPFQYPATEPPNRGLFRKLLDGPHGQSQQEGLAWFAQQYEVEEPRRRRLRTASRQIAKERLRQLRWAQFRGQTAAC
jgi:hypothetical protein